jgi:hypothetical protein
MKMTNDFTQLEGFIPAEWSLVPVDGQKRPIDPNAPKGFPGWQKSRLKLSDLLPSQPHVKALGVMTGMPSGGLLSIDIDSDNGRILLEKITGKTLADLPITIGCTSGKEGSFKLFFDVPESASRGDLRTLHLPGLDLLWNGCQAVIVGEHPTTGRYQWLEGCSPSETGVAEAPDWLVESLVNYLKHKSTNKTQLRALGNRNQDKKSMGRRKCELINGYSKNIHVARQALQRLNPDDHERYEPWLKVGMCLHSVDDSLLGAWIDWSSYMSNFDEQECIAKWDSFSDCDAYLEKTGRKGLGLGTLLSMTSSGHQGSSLPDELVRLIKDKEKGNLALVNYLRTWNIRFNELKRRVEIDGEVLKYDPRYFYLRFAEVTGLSISRELARDALVTVAQERAFNPVADYLESVLPQVTQTEPVSDNELARWFGLDSNDSVSIGLLRVHLRACAMRGMNPGSKMDSVLILSGAMGLRKSTAIKMLPPDGSWYDETTRLDIDNKDTLSSMNSVWTFELSEIEKLTATRESSVLKAWTTRTSDNYVEKYESVVTEHPRRTCLWGTTNAGSFLNDPTGSRRYWIAFVVNPCDTTSLSENRDRLWAHCLSEALEGMPYFLNPTDTLMVEASRRGSNATLTDPWQEKLEGILSDKHQTGDFLSTQNLFALIDCNQIVNHEDLSDLQTLERHTPLDARRLANAMNALGWRSYRTSKERGYIKL